jgi:hypothetical protein
MPATVKPLDRLCGRLVVDVIEGADREGLGLTMIILSVVTTW